MKLLSFGNSLHYNFSEHKKMAASLEKCRFCFGNVPKHLIIAIGTKVYILLFKPFFNIDFIHKRDAFSLSEDNSSSTYISLLCAVSLEHI